MHAKAVTALLAALVACGADPQEQRGHIVVALTVDWEGAYISPDGLDALDDFRAKLGPLPFTHFVSAAYFTKPSVDPAARRSIVEAVRPGDELAVHLHAWRSLAEAAQIQPRLSPSFLTGTERVLMFEDDAGFDTDLDTYDVPALRAMLRTSRRLLEQTGIRVSQSFRAGGYLASTKVRAALVAEGFAIDSSATDYRQLDEQTYLPLRIKETWPTTTTSSQPYELDRLIEVPITGISDYATVPELVAFFDAAEQQLRRDPGHDVVIVLGFHQETAHEFGGRILAALQLVSAHPGIAPELHFGTVEDVAREARR